MLALSITNAIIAFNRKVGSATAFLCSLLPSLFIGGYITYKGASIEFACVLFLLFPVLMTIITLASGRRR